jgi:hypothetical protein
MTETNALWDLEKRGFTYLEPLNRVQVFDIHKYFCQRQVFPGCHVTYNAGSPGDYMDHVDTDVISWHHHDTIRAPHLLEHALQHYDVAAQWLGVEPVLYSVNVFRTRPVAHVRPDIQDWHRDADDVKFLPMFVYLSDVSEQEAQRLRGPGGEVSITGGMGTTFFSNTMLEHLGGKPLEGERIIYWARWGVSDPPAAYVWDKITPVDKAVLGDRYPTDPLLQRAIRLLVR